MAEKFTHIVSLGYGCSACYNLRRFYNFRTAYPFDWWVTPIESAIAFLNDGLNISRLYDQSALAVINNNTSVRNEFYGISLHHEFPRHWPMNGQPIVDDFLSFIDAPRRRTEHLRERFLRLNDPTNRLLFVRNQVGDETASRLRLEQAIASHFSVATWRLATIRAPAEEPVFGWKGDPRIWDELLADLGAELDHTLHAPFQDGAAENTDADLL